MNKRSIEDVLKTYGNKACEDVKREWNNLQSIEGNAEIGFKILSNADENTIQGRFEAFGQKAWIAEYGKGSKMDSENNNPYLSRYKNSDLWNRLRKGHFVTGRPKGAYRDIDNNVHVPSGILAGRVLEKFDNHAPSKPYHVIKNIVTKDSALKELFKSNLKETIKSQIKLEVKRK